MHKYIKCLLLSISNLLNTHNINHLEGFETINKTDFYRALEFKEKPDKAKEYLTSYCKKSGNKAVEEAWKLGDFLWTKYDGKF